MTEKIRYYRRLLNHLKNFDIGNQKDYTGYESHYYRNLLEGRLHLGNMLKYINEEPSVYRKASLERLNGDSDYIPPETDTESDFRLPEFSNKVECIDYIRELLLGLIEELEVIEIDNKMVTLYLNEAIVSLTLARNYGGLMLREIANTRNEST